MMSFFRGARFQKQWFYLNEVVTNAVDLARSATGRMSSPRPPRFELDLSPDLDRPKEPLATASGKRNRNCGVHDDLAGKPVWGDEHQMLHVVMNLLLNALNASQQTDAPVRVSTRLREKATEAITPKEQVEIRVVDYGCGFSQDVLAAMFTPGFSTFGRAGLGLSVVKTLIMREHRGAVHASSAGPGAGATFSVEFPRLGDNVD